MEFSHCLSDHQAKEILRSMNQLRRRNCLCDIELVVDYERFPAHRVLLASCSDYFRAMFTNNMSETMSSSIPIHNVSPHIMQLILDFVYAEPVKVNAENVQELLPAASLLQLYTIKQACCDFLDKQLDSSNCLGIKAFADTHDCGELSKAAEKFICRHFVDVVKHDEFLNLSKEELEGLIKRENIVVENEEPVYESVVKWVRHREQERRAHFSLLLEQVKLPLLSPAYITDVLDQEPLIRSSFVCRDLVDDAKKYHLRPDIRCKMDTRKTMPRASVKDYMVIVGGFGLNQMPIDTVEQYEPKSSHWSLLPPLMTRRRYVGAAQLAHKLFVIGGYDNQQRLNTVAHLDLHSLMWNSAARMNVRRGLAGCVSYRDQIFVAGGFDGNARLSSMEAYDVSKDKWQMMPHMSTGREGSSLVVCADMIYCVGGYDGYSILRGVERFEPRAGKWMAVTSLSTGRSGAGVAVVDNMIYVCGGFDGSQHLSSVECYNPRMDMWTSVSAMHNARCYSSTTALHNKVYCGAGYDGSTLLNSVECFDPLANEWTIAPSMTTPRCDAGICTYQRV